MNIYRPFTGSF